MGQTWTAIEHPPPAGISHCLLLTDGAVFCQSATPSNRFYKFKPDLTGNYIKGTWTEIASLPAGFQPVAYGSAVLADGRVVLVGGEYDGGGGGIVLSNRCFVYDPVANQWTEFSPPAGWSYIGDAQSVVLPDGKVLVGSKLDQRLALLDPATLTWTLINPSGKVDAFNSEETWSLLPDGTLFGLDVNNAPTAERYIPSSATWVNAGTVGGDLHSPADEPVGIPIAPGVVYVPPGEVGPIIRMPNGKYFVEGGNGRNAVYTPPPAGSTGPGTFTLGPNFPSGLEVDDGANAVLPSGRILAVTSPPQSRRGLAFFEFDGISLIPAPNIPNAAADASNYTSLLLLPTGQVMLVDTSNIVEIYTATGTYDPAWAPSISSVPGTLTNGSTYQITGTQFNGISQGTGSGDELENATNYPLVRIVNNATGHTAYARTHNHSSMAVATGSATVSTYFDVPVSTELGASTIAVVANGIPSIGVAAAITSPTPPALSLTCPFPAAQVTFPYNSAAVAAGGQPPFVYSLTVGTLPPGLTFDTASGAITGAATGPGVFNFSVRAVDSYAAPGNISANCTITSSLGPAVGFQGFDITTQGNWKGVHGQDGWIIPNDSSSIPAYAIVSSSGASTWTWNNSTTDVRALLKGASSTDRIASTFYTGSTFSFDINLTDDVTHQLALYALDFETNARIQTVTILDAYNQAVLDTQTMSFLQSGRYAVWNLKGHVIVRINYVGGLNAVIGGLFFRTPPSGIPPPVVSVTSPAPGTISGPVTLTAHATSAGGIASVQFQLDNTNFGAPVTGLGPDYSIPWATTSSSNGLHNVGAIATDGVGQTSTAATVAVTVSNAVVGPAATFVKFDSTTQGNWKNTYGQDGYYIPNDSSVAPSYGTVTPAGASLYTWAPSPSETRALQKGSGTGRIASTYYSNGTFTFDVNLTGSDPHSLALYFLDWDTSTRSQTVSFLNATTNAVLDTRSVTNFHNGVFGVWNVQGHVLVRITNVGNPNAVVNGLFFGGGAPVVPLPTVNLTAPSAGPVTGVVTVTATASSSAGIKSVQFQVDGNDLGSAILSPGPYTTTWNSGAASNGNHALTAIATDNGLQTNTSAGVLVSVSNAAAPPSVSLTAPGAGVVSGNVTITANATSPTLAISSVQFLVDNSPFGSPVSGPGPIFSTSWPTTPAMNGSHTLSATAFDSASQSTTSTTVSVTVSNAAPPSSASATFVKFDTTAQGTWKGKYGGEGSIIANDASNLPSYATLTPTGANTWSWLASTTDPRALQKTNSATDRIASTYYSNSTFTFDLNITGSAVRQVAFYVMDFEGTQRSQRFSILDAVTQATLDTQTMSNFHNGTWAVWNIQGHVLIRVTNLGSPNAVVGGIFFASTTPPPPLPLISMLNPTGGDVLGSVALSASASSTVGIASVQFRVDNNNIGSPVTGTSPYGASWDSTTVTNGTHSLTAVALDTAGQSATSTPVSVNVVNPVAPGPTVVFLGKDTTNQGTWKGRYGQDGAIIANDGNAPPAYATVAITGAAAFTWTTTQDPRALQQYSGTARIASVFYASNTFTIDLNLTGGLHKISVYCEDWDNAGRAESISVIDPATQQVLNTQTLSNFQPGAYLSWNIGGHVQIRVQKTAGSNGVVNGIFFGPPQ